MCGGICEMTSSTFVGVVASVSSFLFVVASVDATQRSAPEPARTAAIRAGQTTFRQFCSPCHGLNGKGDGPVGRLLLTKPADLTQIKRRNDGKFPLATIEQMLTVGTRMETEAHGSEQMPVWGPVFRSIDTSESLVKARVATLLAYLESLQE